MLAKRTLKTIIISMSANKSTYEQLASEEHWQDLLTMPRIPLGAAAIDGFAGVHIFAGVGASRLMLLYETAQRKGFEPERVRFGSTLPLVEKDGLIRVTQDMRKLPLSNGVLARGLRARKRVDSPQDFDDIAFEMANNILYKGESAASLVPIDDERNMKIWRTVTYMSGSPSGYMLHGLHCDDLRREPGDISILAQLPALEIGGVYPINKSGTLLRKIVDAQIILPGSAKRKEVRARPKLSVVPRIATNF